MFVGRAEGEGGNEAEIILTVLPNDPTQEVFVDKFIGFVDILGFTNMVHDAEAGRGMSLGALLNATKDLGTARDRERYLRGPFICPDSSKIARDVDFQLTQMSDSVLVSAEISPSGILSLVHHCWTACLLLLGKGIMCRGSITRGHIFHHDNQFIGSGYHYAIEREQGVSVFKIDPTERSTPFIEVDPDVVKYVANCNDACVKKHFDRMVASDGQLTAVFPFKRLNQSFMIHDGFDADRELESLNNIRAHIREMKAKMAPLIKQDNSSAVAKGAHYFRMLDVQLVECDKTEGRIEAWRRAIADSQMLADARVGTPKR